ncbi:MAG TPA: outer membrane beta-barrel protein [Candidatus Sulfopaludibacter sp.]|nr:outer membrane beta-barrel protein [Candidatus Sulfopaludibacter sp.]
MNSRSIAITVAVLVVSTVAGFAQDWTKGSQGSTVWTMPGSQAQTQNPQTQPGESQFYLTRNLYSRVNVGLLYQQDATLDQTISSSVPPPITTSGTATFNLGLRADAALGYNFNRRWAVEFDTGLLWNSMDKVGTNSLSSLGQSADIYTVPFLVDVTYQIPIKGPWSAYVGAGAGGAATFLSYNTSGTTLSDTAFTFAYQAQLGVNYALTKNASFNLDYEFLGMTDPNWQASANVGGPTNFQFKEKGFYSHTIAISFTWRF